MSNKQIISRLLFLFLHTFLLSVSRPMQLHYETVKTYEISSDLVD